MTKKILKKKRNRPAADPCVRRVSVMVRTMQVPPYHVYTFNVSYIRSYMYKTTTPMGGSVGGCDARLEDTHARRPAVLTVWCGQLVAIRPRPRHYVALCPRSLESLFSPKRYDGFRRLALHTGSCCVAVRNVERVKGTCCAKRSFFAFSPPRWRF